MKHISSARSRWPRDHLSGTLTDGRIGTLCLFPNNAAQKSVALPPSLPRLPCSPATKNAADALADRLSMREWQRQTGRVTVGKDGCQQRGLIQVACKLEAYLHAASTTCSQHCTARYRGGKALLGRNEVEICIRYKHAPTSLEPVRDATPSP